MRFDLVDLRPFRHVAEAGGITKGAARSGLALASASARVRGREEQAGVPLLERGRRGVEPTPAGRRALLHHARLVTGQVERLRGELGGYARGLKGHARLLANTAAAAEFLPELLAAFLAANPNVDVDLDERPSPEVARAVAEGLAEVGIAADHADFSGLEVLPFRSDRLVLVVPRGHALAGGSPSPRRWAASSWGSRATARSAGTWPGTRRGRGRGCGRACGGCAGWTRPAAWWRSAPASPWSPKPRRGGGREGEERSPSCRLGIPGPNAVWWWSCGGSRPCRPTRGGSRSTLRRQADRRPPTGGISAVVREGRRPAQPNRSADPVPRPSRRPRWTPADRARLARAATPHATTCLADAERQLAEPFPPAPVR
jgi:DNA-binding transcriptional LysR family regulator